MTEAPEDKVEAMSFIQRILRRLFPEPPIAHKSRVARQVSPSGVAVPRSLVAAHEIFESENLLDELQKLNEADGQYWATPIEDEQERKNLFASCSSSLSTRTDVVFYESMSGARVMDNPYSIFKKVVDSGSLPRDVVHVWSSSHDGIPDWMRDQPNVLFVRRHSPLYIYLLAAAKHVIGNSVLPAYFVRKPDQKYLNTWHGIGFKRLGRSPRNPFGGSLAVTNMLQATHVISPCSFMTDIMLDGFSLRGTFTGEMAETGYPRIDLTLNASKATVDALHRSLGTDPNKKTVLYAPTWRDNSEAAEAQLKQLESDLLILARLDANIIFLSHHITSRKLQKQNFSNVHVPPPGLVTNELLAIADVLITDYSSIFFDFLITGRPIIHYLYDYRSYNSARGLTLEISELPGEVAFDAVALQALTRSALSGHIPRSVRYEEACARFCPHEDGNAAEHVSRWFFRGEDTGIQLVSLPDDKPRVVFWVGWLPKSGMSPSFLEHLRMRASSGTEQVTLIVAAQARRNATLKELLRELGSDVQVITRSKYAMGMSSLEAEAHSVPRKERTEVERALCDEIYRREYSRIFGDTKFDEIVRYEELTPFWNKLSKFALKK